MTVKIKPKVLRYIWLLSLPLAYPCTGYGQDGAGDEVRLGYTSQPARELGGAVSTVTGGELEKSPVPDLFQTLPGRLSGLITMEEDGQLTKSVLYNYVRGISTLNGQTPLYILDGVICSEEVIRYITPQEIESVSVLKDASVLAIYGIDGGRGAVVITTRRGTTESLQVTVTFDQSFQQMASRPVFIESWEYASMQNQAWANDGGTGAAPYTQAQIEAFRDGTDRELYPNTDFYGMMFRKWALMQRAGISTTAGNEKIRMYSNINFLHQGGQFKNDQATFGRDDMPYNPKAGTNYRVNFRTNLDFRINDRLEGFLRISGNITKENNVRFANTAVYSSLFYLPSTLYGPYTPIVYDEEDPAKFTGGKVITNEYVDNPAYGMLNRGGYAKYTGTNVMAQSGLKLDMGFLTEGLTLEGRFAYETNSSGQTPVVANYERWVRNNDPSALGFDRIGEGTWTDQPLEYQSREARFSYRMHATAELGYRRSFGQHTLRAMAYGYFQNHVLPRDEGIYGFPYNKISSGASAQWGFRDRYFVKADAGYSGSDQYARGNRFTLTPALSAAWIVSDEAFLSGAGWLTFMKLRASAGITANDQMGDGRFMYSDNYVFGGSLYVQSMNYMITEYMRGNPDIKPEKIFRQNYGLDLTIARDFTLSLDYFRSHTDNMLVSNIGELPAFTGIYEGITSLYNAGEMKNHGFEVSAGYIKRVNKDVDVYGSANFMYARNTVVNVKETPLGEDYAHRYRTEGYSYGQNFGYRIDRSNGTGYFTTQEELDRYHYTFGTPRLGDFIYKNLTGEKTADGREIIDEKDIAPIGFSSVPRITYGVNLGARYRGFELSMLLQGTGQSSRQYQNAIGMNETIMGGIYSDIHRNAWTAERAAAGDRITYPALSQQTSVSQQPNDFFIMNTAYLRLRNVELSYSLPAKVLRLVNAGEIKVLVNAQNLFTWDNMRTKAIDPEISALDIFQVYRVFNIGVKLTF
ncbi:MAG: SusC/RagA family TonB-linked outer membrane protein [Alistipes sp.]|nr:SusC/RagA family TonB-linked outer membrane protein [Alistipes sp.]